MSTSAKSGKWESWVGYLCFSKYWSWRTRVFNFHVASDWDFCICPPHWAIAVKMSLLLFPLFLLPSFWPMTVCTLAPVLRPYFEHCVYYFLGITSSLCLKYGTTENFNTIKSERKRPTKDGIWTFGGHGPICRHANQTAGHIRRFFYSGGIH